MEVESTDPFGFIAPESLPLRRFFAKFMLAVPALMTLAVTVQSKSTGEVGRVKPMNAELNRRISEYVPLMRRTAKYIPKDGAELSPEAARASAQMWISEFDEGHIKPLFLTEYSDAINNGITGQIVQTNWVISRSLLRAAGKEAHRGDAESAVSDALTALKVARIFDTCDPTTSSMANLRRRQACVLFNSVAPKLSATSKERVSKELKLIQPQRTEFVEMIERMYDLYRTDAVNDPAYFRRANGTLPTRSSVYEVLRPLYDSSSQTPLGSNMSTFLLLAKQSVSSETDTSRRFSKTLENLSAGLNDQKG